jgi:hypothetical protein
MNGNRIALLAGIVLALALCVFAGWAATSALGVFQRTARPQSRPTLVAASPTALRPTRALRTPTPLPRPATPAPPPSPTATPLIAIEEPTAPGDLPTPWPTETPTPLPMLPTESPPSPTPEPTDTDTPTPTSTPTPIPPGPYSGPYRQGNGSDLHARAVSLAPQIDGDLREWGSPIGQDFSYILAGAEQYGGMADIAGVLYAAWDPTYLYLAARVVDDIIVQTQRDDRIDQGDAIILWLDMNLAEDFDDPVADDDDFQIGLSPGDFAILPPQAFLWRPPALRERTPTILIAARRTADGYTLETAIPWTTLNRQPAVTHAYGFSAQLIDNDQPGAALQDSVLTANPNLRPGVPTTLGNLVLE